MSRRSRRNPHPHPVSKAPSNPVVIWFGRIGDMIMLSTLLEILHRRFGQPCRIIGAGAWTAEIYRSHHDVAEVICLGRHTAFFLDRGWWRARGALRADTAAPVYVCEDFPAQAAAHHAPAAMERHTGEPLRHHGGYARRGGAPRSGARALGGPAGRAGPVYSARFSRSRLPVAGAAAPLRAAARDSLPPSARNARHGSGRRDASGDRSCSCSRAINA